MISVKVLGPGCANCKKLEVVVRKVLASQGLAAEVEKVTDYADIMKWNILSTPGLVVNNKVVSTGRIPAESELRSWLKP